MRWREIWDVLRDNKLGYVLWFFGNVGGLLIAFLASFTIKLYHGTYGGYLPGPDAFLITGTISLAVSGVSYIRLRSDSPSTFLSPALSLTWPFPVMIIYGVLVAMGIKPTIRDEGTVYFIAVVIAIVCLFWASLTWAHEQGIRKEMVTPPEPPKPVDLNPTNLPKLPV